jgi:hypothetical protein
MQPAPQIFDPHRVGLHVNRLGSGAKRAGKVSFAVLTAMLDPEDVAEIVIQGRVHGIPGAAALVGSKIVLANERFWKPEVIVVELDGTTQIQGWQDDRSATVMISDAEHRLVVERIPDRLLAVEFAQRARDRIAGLLGPGPGAPPPALDVPPQPGFG